MDLATRIATAHADTAEIASAGADWAVVAGVPCVHYPLAQPWGTAARVLARPGPVPATVADQVEAWLASRSPHWTMMARAGDAGSLAGLVEWGWLPVLRLAAALPRPAVPAGVRIGPARSAGEFLAVYGAELAPMVTETHLRSPYLHHLVARVDDLAIGCGRLRLLGGTAQLSAITVVPAWRGRGLGAALTVAAGELGSSYSDLVWLHCTDASRPLYERLGFRHVDDHTQLVRAGPLDGTEEHHRGSVSGVLGNPAAVTDDAIRTDGTGGDDDPAPDGGGGRTAPRGR